MATYYISPTGNDTTGNGSSGTPWATFAKFLSSSTAGDACICKDGTYTFANATITDRTIEADNAGSVIFDGGGGSVKWDITGSVTISGLHFTNAVGVTGQNNPIIATSILVVTNLQIINCTFSALKVSNTIQNGGLIANNGNNAALTTIVVKNSLFNDIQKTVGSSSLYASIFGCRDTSPKTTIEISNCLIYFAPVTVNNLIPQVFTFSTGSGVSLVITNCIVDNQSGQTINYRSLSGGTSDFVGTRSLTFNIFHNLSNAPSGNLTSDPQFIDAANGNFSLQTTSPAIAAGDPSA